MCLHTCALLRLVAALTLCPRKNDFSFPLFRQLRLRLLTALQSPVTAFSSSVVLIGGGAPFCQLLVAAGQQDGAAAAVPSGANFSLSCAKLCT